MSGADLQIRVEQIGLSTEAYNQFAKLAMAVEIRERKRFPVSKTVDFLVDLINIAAASQYSDVQRALASVDAALDTKTKILLKALGAVDYAGVATAKTSTLDKVDKKYLYGARGG
jgi:hypothetical protein